MNKHLIIQYSPLFLVVALIVGIAAAFFGFSENTRALTSCPPPITCEQNCVGWSTAEEVATCTAACKRNTIDGLQEFEYWYRECLKSETVTQCAPLYQMPCDVDCGTISGLTGAAYDSCVSTCNSDNEIRKKIFNDCQGQSNPSPEKSTDCKYQVNGRSCDGVTETCAPGCPTKTVPMLNTPPSKGFAIVEASDVAKKILKRPGRIDLSKVQSTGADTASLQNIQDIAEGRCGKSIDNTCVYISKKLLDSMLKISDKFKYSVSAITGGDHCKFAGDKDKICAGKSNHYIGQAFDVNIINGKKVSPKDGNSYAFMKQCLNAGFTEVFGPKPLPRGAKNPKGHNGHIHCGFK